VIEFVRTLAVNEKVISHRRVYWQATRMPILSDGKRFVVRADEKLTAFMALELQLLAAKD